jgi:hypothetical protein
MGEGEPRQKLDELLSAFSAFSKMTGVPDLEKGRTMISGDELVELLDTKMLSDMLRQHIAHS